MSTLAKVIESGYIDILTCRQTCLTDRQTDRQTYTLTDRHTIAHTQTDTQPWEEGADRDAVVEHDVDVGLVPSVAMTTALLPDVRGRVLLRLT